MSKGYNPAATSAVKDDTFAAYVMEAVLPEDLHRVPGIGPAGVAKLRDAGIETTHALMGQFLKLRAPKMSPMEHVNAFYAWLAEIGISSHRNTVVKAVAEKANTWIPGTYNEADFD